MRKAGEDLRMIYKVVPKLRAKSYPAICLTYADGQPCSEEIHIALCRYNISKRSGFHKVNTPSPTVHRSSDP